MLIQSLFSGELPELVLFDLDGTLVDSVPDLAQAIDRMLVALNEAAAGESKVRTWVGNGAPMLVKRALSGQMEPQTEDERFDDAYELFLKFYGEATSDQSELYPGVKACLDRLQVANIKMGLVTNKPLGFTHSMLDGFALTDYFQVILGGDSLPTKKPAPEPLLVAAEQCSVEISKTLMVGDSKSDIGAARAAGCAVACVPYGYNHGLDIAAFEPDLIVSQLDELVG